MSPIVTVALLTKIKYHVSHSENEMFMQIFMFVDVSVFEFREFNRKRSSKRSWRTNQTD